MSKIETLTAELCDELMVQASSGDMEHIKSAIVMLIEYSGCEFARHNKPNQASYMFLLAKDIEYSFPRFDLKGAQ